MESKTHSSDEYQPMSNEIEVIIENDTTIFSWNNETIQEIAEEIGEPQFPESRPCG